MLTPLDPATIATIRAHYAGMELTWVEDDIACAATIAELCDSHEALRAQAEPAEAPAQNSRARAAPGESS